MDNKNKLDITNTFVPYDDHTSETRLLEALGKTLGREVTTNTIQVRAAKATLDKITEGTSVQHRYEPTVARVSWTQRVLRWFRRN
jgi:hypothetical protein